MKTANRTVVQLLNFVPNGTRSMEVFLLAFAEALKEKGWRTVFVFSGESGPAFADRLRELESPSFIDRFPLDLRSAKALAGVLAPYRPDALQTHFMSPFNLGLYRLKRLTGARFFVSTDHSSGTVRPKTGLKLKLAQLRGAAAGRYIDRVVTVSDFIARRDVDEVFLPREKVGTIYNGVDIGRFAPTDRPPADGRPATIAFAGQLMPEKGLHTLLDVVARLQDRGIRPRVLLAGRGPQEAELRAFCAKRSLTGVEFLGQIDWVARLFGTSDVVVVPSEWADAFPFTVCEAMACGGCLLASDAGGIPEAIGTDGTAGVLFRRADADDLERKLVDLLADPARRERIGVAARARAVERFSIETMVANYVRLYEDLGRRLDGEQSTALPQSR